MPSLVLYGSNVADALLPTACDCATTSGGVETSSTSNIVSHTGDKFAEVLSKGGNSSGSNALPTGPTGNGWVYKPGSGSFSSGSWSASFTLQTSGVGGGSSWILRLYRYLSGAYTPIGSTTVAWTSNLKTTYSFTLSPLPIITTGPNDLLYFEIFLNDPTGVSGDSPVVYESTSASSGVVGDVQLTTTNFTSGYALTGGVHDRFSTNGTFLAAIRELFRTGKHRALKAALRSETQHLNATFKEGPMSAPNTTIDVSVTVTDQNNFVVSNLTSCTCTITHSDGSTTGPLTSTNLGNGVYTVTYTTKNQGLTRELWSLTDPSSATAQFLNINPVSY